MTKFILGKKMGMTQIFDQEDRVAPVTLIEAGPCFIAAIRTMKKDGYSALQIAFGQRKKRKVKKSHPSKDDFLFWREIPLDQEELKQYKIGDKIDVSIFKEGDLVKVSGTSKGKGFQGVVKRWKFKGAPATHGHRHDHRAPGSIGSAFPEKVFKGMKMAGRMGGKRVTVKGLEVIKVDVKKGILAVKGALPGIKGGLLEIRGN